MQTGLPTFPVPAFAALLLAVLGALAVRRATSSGEVGEETGAGWWLPALILACAAQAAIVAAVQHYEVTWLRRVQPVTACAIAPLAWLAFLRTATGAGSPRDAWPHLLVPAGAALVAATAPALLDIVLPATFAAYGTVILWRLQAGADAVPSVRLGAGERPTWLWRLIAVSLIGSGVSDVLIAAAIGAGRPDLGAWIITFGSTLTLTLVGWVAIVGDLHPAGAMRRGGEDNPASPGSRSNKTATAAATGAATTGAVPTDDDAALVARLDDLFARDRLHLDPDLSLGRLARRLGVPAKRLSVAVNQVTGGNVSRHVNARRVAVACERLRVGDTVTAAWLASGFATRSNFNREFRRVTGTTPNAYDSGV